MSVLLTGTASMTKSTSESWSMLVVVDIRSLAAVASSLDIRCLLTSFSNSLSEYVLSSLCRSCSATCSITCEFQALVYGSLRTVDDRHRHLRSLRGDESYAETLPCFSESSLLSSPQWDVV